MLSSLFIRNVVLIEALDLSFEKGLTALTGETGAGKSILLDALTMASGARSDRGLVRKGTDKAQSAASFYLPDNHPIYAQLSEAGIELTQGEEITLRRDIRADGRSKAYISDMPVSVKLLSDIGQQLIEIHGQNDGRGLLDVTTHLAQLDHYAGHDDLVKNCAAQYKIWQDAGKNLSELEAKAAKASDDRDFLEHNIAELSRLDPQAGEDAILAQKRALMQASEGALSELSKAKAALLEAGHIESQLGLVLSGLDRVAEKMGADDTTVGMGPRQILGEASQAIERALVEFQEARSAIDHAAQTFSADPQGLEGIEKRLFDLRSAARKFSVPVDGLADYRIKMAHELEQVENVQTNIEAARKAVAKAEQQYYEAADALTQSRKSAALKLDQSVMSELPSLKMDRAKFVTDITSISPAASGQDKVRFLVATNPGSAMGSLDKVASGGEMSRFALAIKVALKAKSDDVSKVMIFDEVDQGVGGAVADAIGRRLSRLSQSGSVFVVTHSPQVASKADQQYRIEKTVSGDMTTTSVTEIDGAMREEEIARMLAGDIITDEARAAARQLMAAS